MENLPENEWMKELEGRLRNYNEQPDETVWNTIAQATQSKREASAWKWLEYSGNSAAVLLVIFLLIPAKEIKVDLKKSENAQSKNIDKTKKSAPPTSKEGQPSFQKNGNSLNNQEERNRPVTTLLAVEQKHLLNEQHRNKETSEASQTATLPTQAITKSFPTPTSTDTTKNQKAKTTDVASVVVKKEEEEKAKIRKNRRGITLYGQVTPSLSYYRIQPLANDEVTISGFDSPSILSDDRLGFAGEIGVQGTLSKKLVYLVGITYYQQRQTLRYRTIDLSRSQVVTSPSDPFSYSAVPHQDEHVVNYSMMNLGLNVGFLYELKSRGLVHKIGLTTSYHQGLRKYAEGATYANAESRYAFYNVLYRVEYPLNLKLKLYIQPGYTRGFYAQEKLAEPFRSKSSRAGLSLGIVKSF